VKRSLPADREIPAEASALPHPVEFVLGEAQVFEELQHLLEPGCYQKLRFRGNRRTKLEDGDVIHPCAKYACAS
jgi:hypothetical protein